MASGRGDANIGRGLGNKLLIGLLEAKRALERLVSQLEGGRGWGGWYRDGGVGVSGGVGW